MKNQQRRLMKHISLLASSSFLLVLFSSLLQVERSFQIADSTSGNSINTLSEGFDESGDDYLFQSNPMELLDALRRATAMEDATPPSDALDEAIKAFESNELVNSSK